MSLILDKSAFEYLSLAEMDTLGRYYNLVVPPILLVECLGDLYGSPPRKSTPEKLVQSFARKLLAVSPSMQVDFRVLRDESLLGRDIQGSCRPVLEATDIVSDEHGLTAFISELAVMHGIFEWQQGNFQPEERERALLWKSTSAVDLLSYQKALLPIPQLASLRSLAEIYNAMNFVFQRADDQWVFIDGYCKQIGIQPQMYLTIRERWAQSQRPFFLFAPYAYYCFVIEQTFFQGLSNGLIRTSAKAKAYVDFQYAYYLPFARIFSSEDKEHKQIWQAFADKDQQMFVTGKVLKDDLKAINDHLSNCSGIEQSVLCRRLPYPLQLTGSFTTAAYQRLIDLKVRSEPSPETDQPVRSTKESEILARKILDMYEKFKNRAKKQDC